MQGVAKGEFLSGNPRVTFGSPRHTTASSSYLMLFPEDTCHLRHHVTFAFTLVNQRGRTEKNVLVTPPKTGQRGERHFRGSLCFHPSLVGRCATVQKPKRPKGLWFSSRAHSASTKPCVQFSTTHTHTHQSIQVKTLVVTNV